jgi:prephenate dehydrogenase
MRTDLLQNATYCLAPAVNASPQAIDTLSGFISLLGAKPYFIEAAEHDGLMAGVQHFPAFLATAYAAAIVQSQGWRERGKLAGAAFRAATELVPEDKQAAREQFLTHRADLTRWVDLSIAQLRDMREVGWVRHRREGRHVFYSLEDEHVRYLYRQALAHIRQGQS